MNKDIIVFDLEATCYDRDKFDMPSFPMEIIEIGAVKVRDGKIIEEFSTFVKPTKSNSLTDFCTELTTITYADLENAPLLKDALVDFQDFVGNTPLYSCGYYDKHQMLDEIIEKKIDVSKLRLNIELNHKNIKVIFQDTVGGKMKGMVGMARKLNIELDGTHHRGIDDARNLAKIQIKLDSMN